MISALNNPFSCIFILFSIYILILIGASVSLLLFLSFNACSCTESAVDRVLFLHYNSGGCMNRCDEMGFWLYESIHFSSNYYFYALSLSLFPLSLSILCMCVRKHWDLLPFSIIHEYFQYIKDAYQEPVKLFMTLFICLCFCLSENYKYICAYLSIEFELQSVFCLNSLCYLKQRQSKVLS